MSDAKTLTPQETLAIQEFKRRVLEQFEACGVSMSLYGSRARGDSNAESDVDILVLLGDYSDARKMQIWDIAYNIFSATDILLSPHVLSSEHFARLQQRERLIAQNIARDGIPL